MVDSISPVIVTPVGAAQAYAVPVNREQYSPSGYVMMDTYARPYPEKKHSVLGFIGKLILAAAVVGGSAALARKHLNCIKEVDVKAEHKKITEKLASLTARTGDFVNDKIVAPVVKFVKGLGKKETKEVTEKEVKNN